tara:strand:+ start:41 stop:403 length:363 start_codon:yes stop_codon:yes gene_type:complete
MNTMKHVVVPVNPTLEDSDLKDQSKVNIPFPENRKTPSIHTNISECCVFLYWITRYIFIFFALSFIGKIAAKFIYWANETNNWEYPDGWDWGDINPKIFLQALVGLLVVMILIGCCCSKS